jgi:GAF domain-containing protein/HAMP domain-containing protein
MRTDFFNLPTDPSDLPTRQRNFYRLLAALLTFSPAAQILAGLGLLAGLADNPAYRQGLLPAALLSLSNAAANLFLFAPLRKGRLATVTFFYLAINGGGALLLSWLWHGLTWFPLALVMLAGISFTLARGLAGRARLALLALTIGLLIVPILTGASITTTPHPGVNLAALNTYLLLTIALGTLAILHSVPGYRTIASRMAALGSALMLFTLAAGWLATTAQEALLRFGLLACLGWLGLSLAARSISQPLEALAEKTVLLKNGEYQTRLEISRQDEVGRLAIRFNELATDFDILLHNLELQLADRSADLQKLTHHQQIAANVTRHAATQPALEELFTHTAQLILDHFDCFHAAIFLIDAKREFAILRASPSEAGRAMLAAGYSLELDPSDSLGQVAATGTAHIMLNAQQKPASNQNHLLPGTQSEITLPLLWKGQVIGLLNVQSALTEAFTQEDVSALQLLADTLALSAWVVDTARDELPAAGRDLTSQSWKNLSLETDFKAGYAFNGVQITPLNDLPPEHLRLLSSGRIAVIPPGETRPGATILAPLKLRNHILGALTLHFQTPAIDAETLRLIEETTSRLALALENARLYAETQKLAQRERLVSDISNRITTSFNVENILRTTAMEIGKLMPDAEVIVQLERNQQ